MPKSKATNVIQIGQQSLVDAKVMAQHLGFTDKYLNRMAAEGKVPWHGIQNGVKTYRRFCVHEVMQALAHSIESDPVASLPATDCVSAQPSARKMRTGKRADNAA